MAGKFEGKVALITGGSSGIGRATGIAFAREGAKVVMAARRSEQGEKVVADISAAGGTALFFKTDVTRADEVEALVAKTVKAFGRLDCAFSNAGRSGNGPTTEVKEELWDAVIAANLKSVLLCMKYEISAMLAAGGGAIVNNSSINGLFGDPLRPVYTASKHGVIGLTKSTALEYAQRGIRVNALCPAVIETEIWKGRGFPFTPEMHRDLGTLHPMHRVGQPEEVADAVMWLCSDAASFITGHSLPIDGGYVTGNAQSRHPAWPPR